MIKNSKKIIKAPKEIINKTEEWLEVYDKLQKTNQQVLFNKIVVDNKKYTIKELSKDTNYSERNIFRIIKMFEILVEIINSIKKLK